MLDIARGLIISGFVLGVVFFWYFAAWPWLRNRRQERKELHRRAAAVEGIDPVVVRRLQLIAKLTRLRASLEELSAPGPSNGYTGASEFLPAIEAMSSLIAEKEGRKLPAHDPLDELLEEHDG